mmetsp:Transcript_8456/g.25410  ORF Transcript_8456/g.25410 Transcript_8456/m.25410 type:complete len:319 (-) Transcript_8456:310-1266(-)
MLLAAFIVFEPGSQLDPGRAICPALLFATPPPGIFWPTRSVTGPGPLLASESALLMSRNENESASPRLLGELYKSLCSSKLTSSNGKGASSYNSTGDGLRVPPPLFAPTLLLSSWYRENPEGVGTEPAMFRRGPLIIARSLSCCLFSKSRSSDMGTSKASISSFARVMARMAAASSISASITTCRGSLKTCSYPGFPRTSFSLSLRMDPLPLIMILQPVSFSRVFNVAPRGPSSLPTKLYSGNLSAGIGNFNRFLFGAEAFLDCLAVVGSMYAWVKYGNKFMGSPLEVDMIVQLCMRDCSRMISASTRAIDSGTTFRI